MSLLCHPFYIRPEMIRFVKADEIPAVHLHYRVGIWRDRSLQWLTWGNAGTMYVHADAGSTACKSEYKGNGLETQNWS